MTEPTSNTSLTWREWLLLTAFCLVLFGVATVSERPLSVHEAVLPQSARTMLADGDWVVPKLADGPWLESPPLPQWVTVSLASLVGRCDALWIVRMGPTLMATLVVLLVAWMAARWFGRGVGLLSGFLMATTCQFTRYAWLAEDEIFLCAVVTAALALFVRAEFPREDAAGREAPGFWKGLVGGRSWPILLFFILLGMTNLAKGLLFGTAMVLIPAATYLLWNRDWPGIKRYSWLWGWLAFGGIALAWPVAVYFRYPNVLELWNYDLGGRLSGSYVQINEPVWYYLQNLLWMLLPWTLVIPAGLWATRQAALTQRHSPERFLWCWALLVPVVFSIPGGKHHHYMLHALAPWAVISSFGLFQAWQWMRSWPKRMRNPFLSLLTTAAPLMIGLWVFRGKLAGPESVTIAIMILCPFATVALGWALPHRNARLAGIALFGSLLIAYCFGHWYAGAYVDRHRHDAAFLQKARSVVPEGEPFVLDLDVTAHRAFLCLFYLDDDVLPIQNLTFLRDDRIRGRQVHLLTRYGKRSQLSRVGRWEMVLRSERAGREKSIDDRLTLFKLDYTDLTRISSADVRVSPMQAIRRADGPFLDVPQRL